jgi:hypothetical protein
MGQTPRSKDLRSAWRWSAICQFGSPSGEQTTKISRRKRRSCRPERPAQAKRQGPSVCSVRDGLNQFTDSAKVSARGASVFRWMALLLGRPHAAARRRPCGPRTGPISASAHLRDSRPARPMPCRASAVQYRASPARKTWCHRRSHQRKAAPARARRYALRSSRSAYVGGFQGVAVGCGGGFSGTIEVLQPVRRWPERCLGDGRVAGSITPSSRRRPKIS